MAKVVLERPGPEAPGYLRRSRRLLEIQERLSKEASLAALDELIGFLLDFVTEPVERGQAREMLLDLSQREIEELGKAVAGAGETPLSPPGPSESSNGGTKASSGRRRRAKE